MEEKYFTAIDYGETSIKLVKMCVSNDNAHICKTFDIPSTGIKNGEIYSFEEVYGATKNLLEKASENDFKIDSLILITPSNKLKVFNDKEMINVIHSPTTIDDVKELQNKIIRKNVTERSIVVNINPVNYYRNDTNLGKTEPIGDRCNSIGMEAYLNTLPMSSSVGLKKGLLANEIRVPMVYTSPLANVSLLLKSQEFAKGVIVLDFGGSGIGISRYQNNMLTDFYRTNLGVNTLVDEIVNTMNLSKEKAEELIFRFGFDRRAIGQDYPVLMEDNRCHYESDLFSNLDNGLKKVLGEVKKKFDLFLNSGDKYQIIVTGGGANINGIDKRISEYLNQDCAIRGYARIGGRDHRFDSCISAIVTYLYNNRVIRPE